VINRGLTFLFCVLVALPAVSAQHVSVRSRPSIDTGDQETIREIIEMERQAREASIRRDVDFSQRTLADDYVGITPLGQVTTKQDSVSARKSRQLRYDTIDVKGHQLGEDFSGPYRYTRVWVRKTGHWQAVSYQATVTQ